MATIIIPFGRSFVIQPRSYLGKDVFDSENDRLFDGHLDNSVGDDKFYSNDGEEFHGHGVHGEEHGRDQWQFLMG